MSKTETACGQPGNLVDLALRYASRGWPVFPCNPLTKRPITEHGHKDASIRPATVREWWRQFPNAMIGCPTGPKSGFWALDADIDPDKGKNGVAVLEFMGDLPATVEQVTPRGGRHSFFQWDDSRPVRNSADEIGRGVDTRGDGGYVILAGSVRSDGAKYQWAISPENGEIREAPEWLYERIRAVQPKIEVSAELAGTFPFEVEPITAEAARTLKEQCLIVAATESGSRNNALNEAAFTIGMKVGSGEISAARATQGLLWAASQCDLSEDDGEDSARKTIASGLSAGADAGVKTTAAYWHEEVVGETALAVSATWSEPATCFEGLPIPAQAWLAPELIPARNVTLFYGDGGTGKSLASLQLAFAVATGTTWLGVPVTRGKALFISAEDERDEIHRRIAAIAAGSGYGLDELGDLHVRSLSGQDAILAVPDPKTTLLKTTPLYATIKAEITRLRPAVIVLDTLADMFGGDEVKRVHARQFIQFLQSYVVEVDFELSVVLLGQPSVSGINSGSGTSGSTAWSNSVRSRLYLERRYVERAEKRVETDTDIRVLTTKKANRTKLGGEIVMRWLNGRFVLDAASSAVRETADDAADEEVFMALLDQFTASKRNVSHNVASPSYAPKLFLTTKPGGDIGKSRLAAAMNRLFDQLKIKIEVYGSPSKGYNRIKGGKQG